MANCSSRGEWTRWWTVFVSPNFSPPMAQPFKIGRLTILKQTENRWHALDQQSSAPDWLQTQGAQQISLTPLTLEDLFVALVKEQEEP